MGSAITFRTYHSENIRAAAILTNAYVVATAQSEIIEYNQIGININFSIGSLTDARIKVEVSHDNVNWYQETYDSISSGTNTESLGERILTTSGKFRLNLSTTTRYLRVSAKGTGDVTASSMTIDVELGRS